MKQTKILAITLLSAALLSACSSNNKSAESQSTTDDLQGEISLSGAFALYPLAVEWGKEFQKLHPGVKVDISAGGAGKGITDALAGMVDFGMVSRELHQSEVDKGALAFAVAKDAVVPIINANNPKIDEILKKGLTPEAATKLWVTQETKTWGDFLGTDDNTPVHVYTRSDACGAAETWANWFGKKQEDLQGTAVYADPGLAKAIQDDIYGIGLNNIGYVYDANTHKPNSGLKVLPIDVNGDGFISGDENFYDVKDSVTKAIAVGKYPSPPARDLYLVSKGVTTNPVVIEFLKYVLSKGQELNGPAGYIKMSNEKIKVGMEKLESKK